MAQKGVEILIRLHDEPDTTITIREDHPNVVVRNRWSSTDSAIGIPTPVLRFVNFMNQEFRKWAEGGFETRQKRKEAKANGGGETSRGEGSIDR